MSKNADVGILTFHDTTNFGACLQAVATYQALSERGVCCEIINYHCAEIDRRETIPRIGGGDTNLHIY